MFCTNCGKGIDGNEKFCINCGRALTKDSGVTSEVKQTVVEKVSSDERWYHRLGTVVYVLAHLPLLFVVPFVWSENARYYDVYFETYRGSDGEAFVWVIITIVIWLLVLRGIKMMLRYVVGGYRPSIKDLIYF
jgi:hypothetical protein